METDAIGLARHVRKHSFRALPVRGGVRCALVIHITIAPEIRVLGIEETTRDLFALGIDAALRQ